MSMYIYLCGPITGISPDKSTDWRNYVSDALKPDILTIDPTRDNPDHVKRYKEDSSTEEDLWRFIHGKGVVARDRMDVLRCEIVLANFLGAKDISIGSVGEIFWADAFRKPVIIVREKQGNPHDHGMINSIASWIFQDLEEAIEKIKVLLL